MAEDNITPAPAPTGQAPTTTPPSPGQDGQGKTDTVHDQPDSDVPEKFKGKSVTDVAKSYLELEKKLGEQSKSVKETRDLLSKWEQLGNVLESDPELYKAVEQSIQKLSGTKTDTTVNDPAPRHDDNRVATENIIINSFEKQYGIESLPAEKRSELHKAIGIELAEMLDPGGGKPVKQVLDSIPLDRLPRYLEKAYRLATINNQDEQARSRAILEARQNNEASFTTSPTASLKNGKGSLTEEERKVARNMGVSEEDYLKEKIALQE